MGERISENLAESIMRERTPDPSLVEYRPLVDFLDREGALTREERGRVVALGDRTATSYSELQRMVLTERGKKIEVEGEEESASSAFFLLYALAARSSKEVSHASIIEQVNAGPGEFGGDPPIIMEGISVLAGLRDICSLRHGAFEAFSSRGGVFPEHYWRIPDELVRAGIGETLGNVNQEIYDIYKELTFRGLEHYLESLTRREGEKQWQFRWRALSHSLDDARQVTNGSFLNHLAMHPNSALALREGIAKLAASEFPETAEIAIRLRNLAREGLPTLMRRVEPSPYTQGLPERRRRICEQLDLGAGRPILSEKSEFLWMDCSPHAEEMFLAAFLANGGEQDFTRVYREVQFLSPESVETAIQGIFEGFTIHDRPPAELEMVQITAGFNLSVGAFFEMVRHRLATYIVGEFIPDGFSTPRLYRELGLTDLYQKGIELNNQGYYLIEDIGPQYGRVFGPLFVSRASLIPVTMRISGLDVFHFLKLRASPNAHPDISSPSSEFALALKKANAPIFRFLQLRDS